MGPSITFPLRRLSIEIFNCKRAPKRGAIGTRDSVANGVVVTCSGMISCWSSAALNAKRCSGFEAMLEAFAADRLGNIDVEENPFIETVPAARDKRAVAFVVVDADWRDPAGRIDCVRCAKARDGKPTVKITKARSRLLERNIGPTANLLWLHPRANTSY